MGARPLARGSVPQPGPEPYEPSHEGDAAVSRCQLEADEISEQLPRPLAKPLNLVVEGDKIRAAGRGQGANAGRSQIAEAAASAAVAESTATEPKCDREGRKVHVCCVLLW